MTLGEIHEALLAWSTAPALAGRLMAARRDHFARHGEPHEEDKSFEQRMTSMLDFYLFDFRDAGGPTTLDLYLQAEGQRLPAEAAAAVRALEGNLHGLFEVRRIQPGRLVLRDVFTGKDHGVAERRQVAWLEKGDLLEARLLPHGGQLHFSDGYLYHPREARKRMLAEVKRRTRAAGRGGRPDVEGFLALLSRMAFKLERYRNVRLESIYDFEAEDRSALTPGPGKA
jgi:hypothetical protein